LCRSQFLVTRQRWIFGLLDALCVQPPSTLITRLPVAGSKPSPDKARPNCAETLFAGLPLLERHLMTTDRNDGFFLSEKSSKARIREAENARKNRAEILKAFSTGKVSRRELVKWGLITTGGLLAPIHGLNPFVSSAYASGGVCCGGGGIPTGAPPSPLFGVQPFSTP